MIYFEKETIQFPRHSVEFDDKLVLTNELTGEKTEIDFFDYSTDDSYYMIDLSDVDLANGTYRYQIGPEVGLMQVGDYISESTQYNEKKQNIVYER